MCHVIPFTLPCCRRVYVSISKLPSCPDSWPKSKCPPELCIQVHGYEPEERSSGECWRCRADAAGKSEYEKQKLRPAIDNARIVIGMFYELSCRERRQVVEEGGYCWFCNAKGGCSECGAKEIIPEERQSHEPHEVTSNKRKYREGYAEKYRAIKKRIKAERSGTPSTPGSVFSLPRAHMSNSGFSLASPPTIGLAYPDPTTSTDWHPDSPYPPNHAYSASPPYGGASSRQTHTSPIQPDMFSSQTLVPWQPGSGHQHWGGYPGRSLHVLQSHDNVPYMGAFTERDHQPRESMHRIIDPSLLQTKSDPDVYSVPQVPWNSKTIELQDDCKGLDSATYHITNQEYQSAYEKEIQQLEDDDQLWRS